ncbi:hypothetical protein C8J57DRAFT_1499922 [Mycena rebaudengoi]|nr:hypothetical protein C8J57DRAFT_1499922 [Mycena rebaudengoi]
MEYYQLGGFGSPPLHVGATDVFYYLRKYPNEPLELILGIHLSGTSHLLLTRDELLALLRCKNLRDRRIGDIPKKYAGDFESLSPIRFQSPRELQDKLGELKPTRNRGVDNSPLNKGYLDTRGRLGVERGRFESSRVFWRILQNDLNKDKFGLQDTSWASSMRVFSFCCTFWNRDDRSREAKKASPLILDVGLCEAHIPSLEEEKMLMSRHILIENNKALNNEEKIINATGTIEPINPKDDYEYGTSDVLSVQKAKEEVRRIFDEATVSASSIVLLVHNEEATRDALKYFDVDPSSWEAGLKHLLRPSTDVSTHAPNPPLYAPKQAPNDPRRLPRNPAHSRDRSASPRRDGPRGRRGSPPPRRTYAPVYIVDVRSMFISVFKTENSSESIPAMCRRLRRLYDPKGWCAGNECRRLVEIFRALAKGRPVDDQKEHWAEKTESLLVDEDESDYAGSDCD